MKLKLYVGLKIPDTTAITAMNTLQRMGYTTVEKLERFLYYEFETADGDSLRDRLPKIDLLVNANKHFAIVAAPGEEPHEEGFVYVLVKNKGEMNEGLLSTLKNRLGLKEIQSVSVGTLWKMHIADPDPKSVAETIAKELLASVHYQEFVVF
ncbi:MAG: hypothetical protein Q7S65_05390 [Nanoarchaeota archaeon]|nr:hypothetical protein [Nanoarchaeota archaeon]